ncbi:tryptophan synthase subunit alpha [Tissierella simiarum]
MPVSNPSMDGEVIKNSYGKVLQLGISEEEIKTALIRIRKNYPDLPIVIMSYFEGIEKYNLFNIKEYYDAILCPDRVLEKTAEDINLIQIYHEEMDDKTIENLIKNNDGFAYVLSGKGNTGSRGEISSNYKITKERIRSISDIPIQIGFGIYKSSQIKELLQSKVDGAIIGSEVIRRIDEGDKNSLSDYIKELKKYTKNLY